MSTHKYDEATPEENMSSVRLQPDAELIDDDNPEWTAEDLAKARPAKEVLPAQFGAQMAEEMLKSRARPGQTHQAE